MMNTIGVMIRKMMKDESGKTLNPSKKNLNKQLLTLHRKLKKNDEIITHYTVEKDYTKGNYHSHLLIQYNDDKNLYNELNKFIGGNSWEVDKNGLDEIKINNGIWGEIHTHNIYDEVGFIGYMNKHEITKTLY